MPTRSLEGRYGPVSEEFLRPETGRVNQPQVTKNSDMQKVMGKIDELSSKLDTNHEEMQESIIVSSSKVREELEDHISYVTARIDNVSDKVEEMAADMVFKTDRCVMIHNLDKPEGETEVSLLIRVEKIVSKGMGLQGVKVIRVKRCYGEPGPVKVELSNMAAKEEVLQAKGSLREKREYQNLYIRPAKSDEQRVMEHNFRVLLEHLQLSDQYRFSSSGRLTKQETTGRRRRRQPRN